MRFLLVAPLIDRGGDPFRETASGGASEDAPRQASTVFTTRADSMSHIISQRWTRLDAMDVASPSDTCVDSWLVTSRGMNAVVLDVSISDDEAETLDVEALEARLTKIARTEIAGAAALAMAEAAWAGRTLILQDGATPPLGWCSEAQDHHTPVNPVALAAGSALTMGWGNSLLTLAEVDPDIPLMELPQVRCAVEGIVDGQLLWLELDWVAARSAHLVTWTSQGRNRVRRGEFGRMSREMSQLTSAMAMHQLAFDDLLIRLQGVRRAVATNALTTWGYSDIAVRVERRLSEVNRVVDSWRGQLDSRYQSAAEMILIVLSLVTSLDLALSFISAAYTGTDRIPGEGSPWGILRWFRNTESDAVLLGMAVILAGVGIGILITRALRRR